MRATTLGRGASAAAAFFLSCLAAACSGSVDVGEDPTETGTDDGSVDGATDTGVGIDTGTKTDGTPADSTGLDGSEVGGDTEPLDTGSLDTGSLDTGPLDTGVVDTGPPPTGCAATPLAADPANTLDPQTKGPLAVARKTIVFPKLGPLTSVNVRVWYPTDATGAVHPGRHAWVMFHHAVNGKRVIYDNYNGIFDHWASHGFIIFSIDGSKIFFPTTSGTSLTWTQQNTVAQVISEGITYALTAQETSTWDFSCKLDIGRVAIAGHSRGGGATILVPHAARTDGAKIRGLVSFQGVDPGELSGSTGTASIPGFDLPAIWFDAGLDGDVIYPINALQYGRTRNIASFVTILGSKHTFTLDDWSPTQGGTAPTVTADEHKAVINQYGVAFMRARVRDATPGASDLGRIAGPSGFVSTASSGDITLSWRLKQTDPHISKFQDPVGTFPVKTDAGGSLSVSGSMAATTVNPYAGTLGGAGAGAVIAEIMALQLKWDATGGVLEIPVAPPTGKTAIVFDYTQPTADTTSGATPFFVEATDTAGGTASVPLASYLGSGWAKRPRRFATAYVPLAKLTGVALDKLKSIRLVTKSGAVAGTAMIDQLRFE